MNKKILTGIMIVGLVIIAGILLFHQSQKESKQLSTPEKPEKRKRKPVFVCPTH